MADRGSGATGTGSARTRPTRAVRVLRRLDGAADRRWFLPATAVFPLADYALPVLPNQALLVTLAVLHPRRWWALALTFVTAGGLGALLVATAVHAGGGWVLDVLPGDPDTLAGVTDRIRRHGLVALVFLSLLPWPPRAAVLACALAGLAPWSIAATVTAGRLLPVATLALAGARAPHLLRRLPGVDRLMTALAAARAAGDAGGTASGGTAVERRAASPGRSAGGTTAAGRR